MGVHAAPADRREAAVPPAQIQLEWSHDQLPPSSEPPVSPDWEGWSTVQVWRGPASRDHACTATQQGDTIVSASVLHTLESSGPGNC